MKSENTELAINLLQKPKKKRYSLNSNIKKYIKYLEKSRNIAYEKAVESRNQRHPEKAQFYFGMQQSIIATINELESVYAGETYSGHTEYLFNGGNDK